MTSWREELTRTKMIQVERKNIVEACMYQITGYADYAIDVRGSHRARARMLEPTGSYPALKIIAVGFWKSVPRVSTPGRIVATTPVFQLLTTLY